MKLSTLYHLYPENRSLQHRLSNALSKQDDEMVTAAVPDTSVAVADNFRFTRGNHEQYQFSTRIYEPLREALEAAQTSDAQALCNRGNVLAALGQQRRDAALFERAIQCFELALENYTQENAPQEWAAAQYDLATASQALGRLQDDTKPLKVAIDAYTAALQVWTRETSPQEWMDTMHQLGDSLHTFGTLLNGNRHLQKSVVAYKNALAALDADNYALKLTAAHNNRAIALHHLSESEANPERMKEALRAYEKAVTVSMEQQLPIHVAVLCRVNKATAQNVLAQMTEDAGLAEEVADEFEVIMECFSHALQPLCLKHCKEQLQQARGQQPVAQAAG